MTKKVIVTSAIGNFDAEQELTSQANIVKYVKTMLNEGRDEADATKLSAKQIMAAVEAIEGDYDGDKEVLMLEALEALEAGEPADKDDDADERQQVVTAEAAKVEQAEAATLAAKLDKETMAGLTEAWDIKRRSGVMPLVHMLNLQRCWGKEGMRGTPIGGSVKLDIQGRYVLALKRGKDDIEVLPERYQNLRPDKYKVKGGDNKTHAMSFYGDVFDATAEGIATLKRIAAYEAAMQSPPQYANDDDKKALGSKDAFTLAEEKKTLETGRSFQIGQLRKAVSCFRQMEDINGLPIAGCYIYTVKRGTGKDMITTVKSTTAPVVIFDWADLPDPDDDTKTKRFPSRQLPISIGTFLKFDVEKAKALGGNREALEKTVARDVEEAKRKKAAEAEGLNIVVKNTKQMESAVAEIAFWEGDAKLQGDLLSALHKEGTDPFLASIFKAGKLFDWLMSREEFRRRWAAMNDKPASDTKTAAAA